MHVKENGTPLPSQSSSLEGEQSYWRRSRSLPSKSFTTSFRSIGGERHRCRRVRTSPSENMGSDAMGKALCQISQSPFSSCIEEAELPHCFTQPTFTIYNGKTNLVEHVSHFNKRMTIYSRNKAFMCKVFPSSLRPIAMRWFDGLKEG